MLPALHHYHGSSWHHHTIGLGDGNQNTLEPAKCLLTLGAGEEKNCNGNVVEVLHGNLSIIASSSSSSSGHAEVYKICTRPEHYLSGVIVSNIYNVLVLSCKALKWKSARKQKKRYSQNEIHNMPPSNHYVILRNVCIWLNLSDVSDNCEENYLSWRIDTFFRSQKFRTYENKILEWERIHTERNISAIFYLIISQSCEIWSTKWVLGFVFSQHFRFAELTIWFTANFGQQFQMKTHEK